MPSEDPINEVANQWWYRDAEGQIHEIAAEGDNEVPSRPTENAARVQQLAAVLGFDSEQMAKRIPEDTLRRLKFPLVEQRQPDGTVAFQHDKGITNEVQPLIATDRAHEPIPPGSNPQPRDASGKFTK